VLQWARANGCEWDRQECLKQVGRPARVCHRLPRGKQQLLLAGRSVSAGGRAQRCCAVRCGAALEEGPPDHALARSDPHALQRTSDWILAQPGGAVLDQAGEVAQV